MPELDTPDLTSLTANLVAAFLRGNSMPVSELPDLIRTTHAAMAGVLAPPTQPVTQLPAVSIKKSVRPHAIVCLECGREKQMLKRHLGTAHGLSVDEYKARWSLPADYPMTAPDYAGTRSDLAKKFGLGRKAGGSPKATADVTEPEKAPPLQKYPASRWSKPIQ